VSFIFRIKLEESTFFSLDLTRDGFKLISDIKPLVGDVELGPIIPFFNEGESPISGKQMIKKALKFKARLGQRDGENIIRQQKLIPYELRKYTFPLTGTIWQGRFERLYICYIAYSEGEWRLKIRHLNRESCESARLLVVNKKKVIDKKLVCIVS
jgi:hypothetical protein